MRLLGSELFRMRRRWMPWVLLILVIVLSFALYFIVWASVRAQIEAVRAGQIPSQPGGIEQLEQTLRELSPDHVQGFGIGTVTGIGSVMLIVFAASHVGGEFGWGTFRTLLAHGASRGGFLASKAVSLVTFAAVFMVVGTVAAIAASYTVTSVAALPVGTGLNVNEIAAVAAKSAYTFVPYMALALVIAVVARSGGAGIAAALVVYFAESIVAGLLVTLNREYANVVNWGLSRNASSLTRPTTGSSVTQDPTAIALPDPAQAALVLAAYTIAFLALAYWRLRRRDVTVGG